MMLLSNSISCLPKQELGFCSDPMGNTNREQGIPLGNTNREYQQGFVLTVINWYILWILIYSLSGIPYCLSANPYSLSAIPYRRRRARPRARPCRQGIGSTRQGIYQYQQDILIKNNQYKSLLVFPIGYSLLPIGIPYWLYSLLVFPIGIPYCQ